MTGATTSWANSSTVLRSASSSSSSRKSGMGVSSAPSPPGSVGTPSWHDRRVRFAGAQAGPYSRRERPVKTLLAVYYRLSNLVRELLKFGVVGGLAFVVDV